MIKKNKQKKVNLRKKKVKALFNHKRYKILRLFSQCSILIMTLFLPISVFATDDPLTVVNNLSNFIFSLIRAVGLIILGMSIVQIGLSIKSHDPSQRANGFLTLAGGVIITFAKEILNMIIGG